MRKQNKIILLLVLVLTVSLIFTGCGNQGKSNETNTGEKTENKDGEEKLAEEQVLRINWGEEPPDLDPQTTTDQVSIRIINAIYEGLVRLDPDGNVKPGLAEKWDVSDDKLTYTFHLRDAKWSDGTPITAEDFEYCWFKAIDPKVAAEYSYQLTETAGIKNAAKFFKGEITDKEQVGIKAIDEKTFEVELERPVSFFLSLVSFPTFIPAQKAAIEKFEKGFASEADKMVYSGPFIIDEWDHEQKLNLKKNEQYWDAENVKLEEIKGDMIVDNNTAINLYETEELDITGVGPEFIDKYKDSDEFGNLAEATTWYIQYNCKDKYLKNENLRYALSLAIDRKAFVENVMANGSIIAEGLTPTLLPGKDGKEFAENRGNVLPEYDPKKAKEYLNKALDELGITAKELEKYLTFLTGESDIAKKQAAAIQNMWKQNLGIEVEIESVSFKIRIDNYNRGDYTTTFAGWGGDYNDPLTFMDIFITDGGNNNAYWSSKDYDVAIKTALEGEENERIDAMVEAEKIIGKELPIIPIFYNAINFVEKSYVKGVARFPVGADLDFKWTYIVEH